MQGLRSDPPPNHQACGVQNIRVFICTAGQCGFCIWATSEMPAAQNLGSSRMPGIPLRAAIASCARAPNVPKTVETFTPTFSNTRPPRITLINPPPASEPSSAVRCVGVTVKVPQGASISCCASIASKRATISSRNWRNHALAAAFSESNVSIIALFNAEMCSPRQPGCGHHLRLIFHP